MDMMPTAQATPGAEPPMGEEAAPQAEGFTVCIVSDATGQLSVGVRPGTEGAEGYMPVADRKQALTLALEALKSEGKMEGGQAAIGRAGFESGFEE